MTAKNKQEMPWPHKPEFYKCKGTIKDSKFTRKFLAYCSPRGEDVIVEIKNIEMMWDMNAIDKMMLKLHEIMNMQHDNILSPIEIFQYKSEIWIIYPFISGSSLSELFKCNINYINGIKDEDIIGTILYDVLLAINVIYLNSTTECMYNNMYLSLYINKQNGKTMWNTNNVNNINNKSNKNNENILYMFGMLAMQLYFGPQKDVLSIDDIKDINNDEFEDLINKCISCDLSDKIHIKQIIKHEFFMNHKCLYNKVIECVTLLNPIQSKLLKLNGNKNINVNNNSNNKSDLEWDFDDNIGSDSIDNIQYDYEPLILNEVEYDSNDDNSNKYENDNTIMRLNVGGNIFLTTLKTAKKLRKYGNNISNNCFIDRDSEYFRYILNYLRTNKLLIELPNNTNILFYKQFYEECLYFKIKPLINMLNPENIYFYSKILPNNFMGEYYIQQLRNWIANKNQKWKLIYRASNDGYRSHSFHSNCDLQGSTITLIYANNKIFGGYTDISWKSYGNPTTTKKECISTFIFHMNVTNKLKNLKAFKYNFLEKYYSNNMYGNNLPVVHQKDIGPAFGWYHILCKRGSNNLDTISKDISQDGIIIRDQCNIQNNSCWTYCAYFDTPKNTEYLAGSKYFFVKDIEVYKVSFDSQ